MDTEFWEGVRQRAHALWLEEGCPEGKSDQHWQQAQRDMLASVPAAPVVADVLNEVTLSEAPPCTPREAEADTEPSVAIYAAPSPADPAPSTAPPVAKGTSLFKIKARQCRYITSETSSPAIFCGAPTEGGSWCCEHNARVFVRSAPRPLPKVDRQPVSR